MVTREVNREDGNRVIIRHIYPATQEFVCTLQLIVDDVVVMENDNLVFPPDAFELTEEELVELGVNIPNDEL